MKMMKARYYRLMMRLLISSSTAFAGNNLAAVHTATNTLEVQLSNSEEVAGLKFNVGTSSDRVLCNLERDTRTQESHWLFASYKPNDRTVNVVILSMERKSFSYEQGTLAKISFTTEKPTEMSYASLTNVMITNNNESKSFIFSQKIASGMYFARLNVDNESVTRKMEST